MVLRFFFFLRLWRLWLKSNQKFSISDNFISLNTYVCLEINAKALLDAIDLLKTLDSPELFLPWLFSSQACESFFRSLRSLSSTYSTIPLLLIAAF